MICHQRHPFRFRSSLRFVPHFETFEDRELLSTCVVTNLGDNGAGGSLMGDLRYCVNQSNASDEPSNRIEFASGLGGTISLTQGALTITKSVQIDGPGSSVLTVSGANAGGVFYMPETPQSSDVVISGMTITDGIGVPFGSGRAGGGVFNWNANLTLTQVKIAGNSVGVTSGRDGGGLHNVRGVVNLDSCMVTDNQAYAGGGLANTTQGKLTLAQTTVSANNANYGGGISNTGMVILKASEVSANTAAGTGGGIANIGFLTLVGTTVTGNQGKGGAGIETNNGQVVISDSTISSNLSPGVSGGGIFHQSGSVSISRSTLVGNSGYSGGAIFTQGGNLQISDSTISGNTAQFAGGGIFAAVGAPADSTFVELIGSTVTRNVALANDSFAGGGGIRVATGPSGSARFLPRSSLIAENRAISPGPDVKGPAISLGYNLIGNADDSSGWTSRDQIGSATSPIDPHLGPLKDNGGPTLTHAVLAGSPAIRTGDPSLNSSFDQRYTERAFVTAPDVGAFQAQAAVRFRLLAPVEVPAGEPFNLTVVALDGWDNTASTYAGTIHFSSSDAGAELPGNYSFTAGDGGEHVFVVTLPTAGGQLVLVNDVANPARKGRVSILVLGTAVNHGVGPRFLAVTHETDWCW